MFVCSRAPDSETIINNTLKYTVVNTIYYPLGEFVLTVLRYEVVRTISDIYSMVLKGV